MLESIILDSVLEEILKKRVSRRRAISVGAKVGSAAAVAAVVAGSGGYFVGTTVSSAPKIDPIHGFIGMSTDVPPPKKPDHVVQLLIKPRPPIPIPEFFFQPTGLFIKPGETVQFVLTTPEHTITAYHPGFGFTQRVPDGIPPFSSPVLPVGAYWLYTFEKEGVYDMYCAPHQILGMTTRIVAGSATGPGASPVPPPFPPAEQPPFPPFLGAALVLGDPALAPDNIISKGSVVWEDIKAENKIPLIGLASG